VSAVQDICSQTDKQTDRQTHTPTHTKKYVLITILRHRSRGRINEHKKLKPGLVASYGLETERAYSGRRR